MKRNNKNRTLKFPLVALQAFIGLTAIKGGYGLMSDPSGATMNTPIEWLNNSPFTNYFIPGLVLLIIIGVVMSSRPQLPSCDKNIQVK